jgi:hypothetical protein
MPGPKLFGIEDAGEEETEPSTGRVVPASCCSYAAWMRLAASSTEVG